MAREFYASSPTVVLPPQQPTGYFSEQHGFNSNTSIFNNTSTFGQPSPSCANPASTFAPSPLTPSSNATCGRKRSRADVLSDDDAVDLEDGSAIVDSPVDVEPPKPRGEPVYGPGMTLIYPDDPGFSVISPGSQTGTWHEEQAAAVAAAAAQARHAQRPSFSTRKSQRLDRTAPGLDDIALSIAPSPPKTASLEPMIDDAARALGIGWSMVHGNPELEIPSRAYSKYIENHFPLSDVSILVFSKSMPAYLISAVHFGTPGFFLFQEDLQRGQLVSTNWDQALVNIRSSPIVYEGADFLVAVRTPSVAGVAAIGGIGMGINGMGGEMMTDVTDDSRNAQSGTDVDMMN